MHIIQGSNQFVESKQQTFLAVAQGPTSPVIHFDTFGQWRSFGEVDQPHSHLVIIVHDEDAAADHLVALEEFRLFDKRSHLFQSFGHILDDAFAPVNEIRYGALDFLAGFDCLHIGDRRGAAHFECFYPEALLLRRGHVFPKQHVSQLGDGLSLVFLGSGRLRIDGDHFFVQIFPERRVGDLVLRERPEADLDVHHVRIVETVQQVLQFDEVLTIQPMYPEKFGHDLAGVGIDRQLPIGQDFRIVGSGYALADDAIGHRGNAFGMTRELQPTGGDHWGVVLQEDGTSGGTQLKSIDCKKAEQ